MKNKTYIKRIDGQDICIDNKKEKALYVHNFQHKKNNRVILNGELILTEEEFQKDYTEITVDEYYEIYPKKNKSSKKTSQPIKQDNPSTVKTPKKNKHDIVIERAKEAGIVRGAYIKKQNFTVFNHKIGPTIEVRGISSCSNHDVIVVNGKHQLLIDKVDVITQAEHEYYQNLYKGLSIDTKYVFPKEVMCYVNSTGEKKVGHKDEKTVLVKLFELRMKNPHKDFRAYHCNYCGLYHIGKWPTNTDVKPFEKKQSFWERVKKLFKWA